MTALPVPQFTKRPLWLVLPATAALAWNVFGLWQFGGFLTQTQGSLVAQGMTGAQALAYTSLPGWMTLVFAVGVIGGTIGTGLLLLQRRLAVLVLAVSLPGYIALFAGDWAHGLFDILPTQLAILSSVVAIAGGSLALSLFAARRGILR
ncbi:MAG: hypothetical protein NTW20_05640 [Rhodobacterales bacterium]|nr:hypothetical protein [Rhodobacterales bacterium]